MKDATGELSMTAVAVVAIGLISSLFIFVILPAIKTNISRNTYCSGKFNCNGSGNVQTCNYYKDDNTIGTITCPTN